MPEQVKQPESMEEEDDDDDDDLDCRLSKPVLYT